MQIKQEKLPKSEVKLTVKLTKDEAEKLENKASETLSQQVKVAGFRPGKAPKELVIAQIGEEGFFAHVLEANLPYIYAEAVQKEGIIPIAHPKIEVISNNPIEFVATIAVKPEFTIKNLDKVKIKAKEPKVAKKEVEDAIKRLRTARSGSKEVEREAKKGDRLEIDFTGTDEKKEKIAGAESKNHPIVLGEGMFIPGFEDNLMGVKKNDEKDFKVTFPKDYHEKSLAGKPVNFHVKIHKVEEVVLPEINEEFVEQVLNKKVSVDEFEKEIEENLVHHKIHEIENAQEEELFDTLLKNSDFDVSDILVAEELQMLLDEIQQNTYRQGIDFEQYKNFIEAKEKKSLKEIYESKAKERVKLKFIIEYIIKGKDLKADESEIEAKTKEALAQTPKDMHDKVKKYYEKEAAGYIAAKNEIILKKLFAVFIERVKHDCKQ